MGADFIKVEWANAGGPERSFGVQAAICVAGFLVIVGLQVWGKRLRTWSGKLNFKTN